MTGKDILKETHQLLSGSGHGKPGVASVKKPEKNLVIAVDLGATNTRVATVDHSGTVVEILQAPTPDSGLSPQIISDHILSLIRELGSCGKRIDFVGIGISTAGPVDPARGMLVNPPNIPFPEIPLIDPVGRALGIPARLLNDCHAGVIGEFLHGRVKGRDNVVYLTLSTGIGAGVIAGGRLFFGREGNAAEVGHFHVDSVYNVICGCGHAGHWEGYASGRNIPRFFARWAEYHGIPSPEWAVSAGAIFQVARFGNLVAQDFIEELGKVCARGLSDIIVAYDPAIVILDGPVIRENADLLLPLLKEYTDRFLPCPEVLISSLGGNAPLLGAAAIAWPDMHFPGLPD